VTTRLPESDPKSVDGPTTVVEVFADVWCPFAHVGLRRFVEHRALVSRDDLVLRVRAWPLELVNGRPLDPGSTATHVAELRDQVAPYLFGGFAVDAFPVSSVDALALAAVAYEAGDRVGERVSLALRDALFEAGRNIGDPSALRAIAAEQGIADAGPEAVDLVIADWEDGKRRGIRGSPEFFVKWRGFFCPTLDITRVDGGLRIVRDIESLTEFLDAVLEN
jgi:predicted DsbA family dithiol-disulfide isomerase